MTKKKKKKKITINNNNNEEIPMTVHPEINKPRTPTERPI